jgi:hypothetical protein
MSIHSVNTAKAQGPSRLRETPEPRISPLRYAPVEITTFCGWDSAFPERPRGFLSGRCPASGRTGHGVFRAIPCIPEREFRSRAWVVEKLRAAKVSQAPPRFLRLRSGQALRLRATSAVSRDPSVRRSAQDDDFVGVLKIKPEVICPMGLEKQTSWLKPSGAQAIYGTAYPAPFGLASVKASGGAKKWPFENLIWTSLAELSQDCVP